MGRKYYKRTRGNRDKYSVEQTAGTINTNTAGDGGVTVVPSASIQGMRKIKHLTVSMSYNSPSAPGQAETLYWALVYVPSGMQPATLTIDGGAMYEPNQYVMGCGVFDFNAGPLRVRCPLSRNLNSGDSIALVVHNSTSTATNYAYVVRYAVTLQ